MNTRNLLNWFLSPSFDCYNMSQYDIMNVAQMICNESTTRNAEKISSSNNHKHIYVPDSDMKLYAESEFLKPVCEIKSLLNDTSPEYVKHFLLHGSLADLKYIKGWSDLDTWVVICDRVFKNTEALVELRSLFSKLNKFLLKVDPIAHHGFIIILESDLDHYNDSVLPAEVISTARNLYGSSEVCICDSNMPTDWVKKFKGIRDTFVEFCLRGVFMHHPYKGKYLTKDMVVRGEGMYQLKYLIGTVMMFPSMYYSAIGKSVYKAKSFEPFLIKFPTSSLIIERISKIRVDWGIMEQHPYAPNHIPGWLIDRLPQDYVSQTIRLLDDIIVDIMCNYRREK